MTKAEALYQFFSSFGLHAFEENSVPTGEDAPELPYVTYNVVVGAFNTDTPIAASLWYEERDGSSALLNVTNKADEIELFFAKNIVVLECDEGAILMRLGSPHYQIMGDPNNDKIKRANMNFTASFLTSV